MFPQTVVDFYAGNQELLWLTTLFVDLGFTVLLYRLFGKAGLQVAITTAIILANLQGPKLTVIFGLQTSLGVIFYSSIFFATDVLSENYGKAEANKAVRMGFAVSVIVLVMLSLALLYLPSDKPATAEFSATIHGAFATIINFTPRMIFGSLLAYIISQSFDVWAFHKIKTITGVEVREATAEVEPATGTVVGVFTTGTTVQVYLLADSVPADSWGGTESGNHP